ncbi:hypothetical protein [Bacillus piscicola]|uniref:hypothetical protein n=1 Tax=Bacillus piscicola TaxID=1632684 RepID=UPI001F09BC23|nr:hypothetical protein [Bacillus piscicola]
MKKVLAGIIGIVISFVLFVLGLMKLLPVFIGSVLLFLSIFLTIFSFSERRRFKGIKTH